MGIDSKTMDKIYQMMGLERNKEIKFHTYPEHRDVVFVLGAGASKASGLPLQSEILTYIFSDEAELNTSPISLAVKKFITENFYVNKELNIFPPLETVFAYIDYFINQKIHLSSKYTVAVLTEIREKLILLIFYIIHLKSGDNSVYKKFWDTIAKYNMNISIISMNYDTLLDDAFDFLYYKKSYIDYCIEILNYKHMDKLDAFDWWVNPREPFECDKGSNPIPIKILKVHGSIDWRYCRCCNKILLKSWNTEIDMTDGLFKNTKHSLKSQKEIKTVHKCPLDGTNFETLIIPPSHNKELNNPVIQELFQEALNEIRCAKNIIFVGYSFPEADVHFKCLFKRGITNQKIYVVDKQITPQIIQSYSPLTENIEFVESTFESYIESKELKKVLKKGAKKSEIEKQRRIKALENMEREFMESGKISIKL